MASADASSLLSIALDGEEYVGLLSRMMEHVKNLQNSPPALIPQEDLVADIIVEYLKPYTQPQGPLLVKKLTYVEKRSNVIVHYPAANGSNKVISIVGAHMDVVPANPDEWKYNPFTLTREGDMLYGRGVTDCLGHVALVTILFKHLAILKPKLNVGVAAVFISNEESSAIMGIGIDEVAKHGELDFLKNGPLIWLDSADFGPTLGTGGMAVWKITAHGKGFHSGFPHKAINPISLASHAVHYIQKRFYEEYPAGQKEQEYKFQTGSSLKPTSCGTPPGSPNIIPKTCTIGGDIRITPFHKVEDVKRAIEKYVREINDEHIPQCKLSTIKYDPHIQQEEGSTLHGRVELEWVGAPYKGVAVDLKSPGFKALYESIAEVNGSAQEFALTGSLPIIADLQEAGFDVQITGFGKMSVYHAANEYGKLSDFVKGFSILTHLIHKSHQSA